MTTSQFYPICFSFSNFSLSGSCDLPLDVRLRPWPSPYVKISKRTCNSSKDLISHCTEVTTCFNPALKHLEVLPGIPWRERQWNRVSSIDMKAQSDTHDPGQYTLSLQNVCLALGRQPTSVADATQCYSQTKKLQMEPTMSSDWKCSVFCLWYVHPHHLEILFWQLLFILIMKGE